MVEYYTVKEFGLVLYKILKVLDRKYDFVNIKQHKVCYKRDTIQAAHHKIESMLKIIRAVLVLNSEAEKLTPGVK